MSQLTSARFGVRKHEPGNLAGPQKAKTLRWWLLTVQPTHKDYCDAVVGHLP